MAASVKIPATQRDWLTLEEAAARIGAKPKTLRHWIVEGIVVPAENGTRKRIALYATKPVGVWRITPADLEAFCEARTKAVVHPCAVRANGEETEAASRRRALAEYERTKKRLEA